MQYGHRRRGSAAPMPNQSRMCRPTNFCPLLQIIYADSFHLTGGDYKIEEEHITHAVRTIRAMKNMAHVPLIWLPENAPGNQGENLWKTLIKMQLVVGCHVPRLSGAGKDKRRGIDQTPLLKDEMTRRLTDKAREQSLFFSSMFTAGPGDPSGSAFNLTTASGRMRERICTQAAVWQLRATLKNNKVAVSWTGKVDGKNDDVTMALLLALKCAAEVGHPAGEEWVKIVRQM